MPKPSPFAGLLLFALWIAAEIAAFSLVAGWVGGGMAFFLLVMKSVLGGLLAQQFLKRKLFSILRQGGVVLDGADAARAWVKGLGGVLLIMPGFATGVLGLVLLAPPVQRWLAGRAAARMQDPRDIDLQAGDWREAPDQAPQEPSREPPRRIPGRKPDDPPQRW